MSDERREAPQSLVYEGRKELLHECVRLAGELDSIMDRIEALRTRYTMPVIVYDDMPHGSGRVHDLSEYAAALDSLHRKYMRKATAYFKVYREVLDILEYSDLTTDEELILRYRFILRKKWAAIADVTNKDIRHCYRILNKGMSKFIGTGQ